MANLIESLRHSVQDIGMIMLIIMLSSMIGYVITLEAVPQSAAEFLIGITSNSYLLMILLINFIIMMGCLLESTVIVLLLTILVPVVQAAGIDLVHFGLVMMTATTLGSMTPPVGVAMFAVTGIMKCDMHEYAKEAIPFIGAVVFPDPAHDLLAGCRAVRSGRVRQGLMQFLGQGRQMPAFFIGFQR